MWLWLGIGCAWIGPAEFDQRLAEPDTSACDEARYPDLDGDGFGAGPTVPACPDDPATSAVGGDCDDDDDAVHPGVEDGCDGVDDDCDGETDEDDAKTAWFLDGDGDGYGSDAAPPSYACAQPPYTAARGGDCDDANADVHPGLVEVCENDKDDDCDGIAGSACRPHGRVTIADADVRVTDDGDGIGCDLVAGDFADDGGVDLAGTGRTSRRLHAFFGSFQPGDRPIEPDLSVTLGGSATAEIPSWATWGGDRDRDGAAELLLTDSGPSGLRGAVALYEGPLTAGAKPLVTYVGAEKEDCLGCYDTGLGGSPVARLGDFDGDGLDDLAAIAPGAGLSGVVYVFSGADTGSVDADDALARFTSLDGEGFVGPVSDAGDGDNDGYADLAFRAAGPNRVALLRGDAPSGPALASAAVTFTTAEGDLGARLAACADIGGGRPALAVALSATDGGAVAILPVDGAGVVSTDAALGRFGASTMVNGLSCDDVDADGVSDLTSGHVAPKAEIAVSYGPLDRTLDAASPADWVIGGATLHALVTADTNGDGVRDVAYGDCDAATYSVFFGGGF